MLSILKTPHFRRYTVSTLRSMHFWTLSTFTELRMTFTSYTVVAEFTCSVDRVLSREQTTDQPTNKYARAWRFPDITNILYEKCINNLQKVITR